MEKTNNTIKYFGYCRKSSEQLERQALSISAQKNQISKSFNSLEIIEVLEEQKSAFKPNNRTVFREMIKRIKKGEADGIICWHPDRLSRNEIDAAQITYMVRTGEIKDLKFDSYHFDNSALGILTLQSALSHSQYSSARLSEDVKRGLQEKVRQGWLPSLAPAGYTNTPDKEKGYKIIVKDPDRFHLVRKMWDLMLTGNYTAPQILSIANDKWGYKTFKRRREGGKPLSRSSIYKIFSNKFYAGWIEWPKGSKNWHKGKHIPMISEEEFERVQILSGRNRKPKPHHRMFSFSGLIKCSCGCSVSPEAKNQLICPLCKLKFAYENKSACPGCNTPIEQMKNPTILNYVYYRCTKKKRGTDCNEPGIELKQLEKQIDAFLSSIELNPKYLDWAIKHLRKAHKLESYSRESVLNSQQKAYHKSSKKLDRLLEMRLAQELDEKEYASKKSELLKEKEKYKNLLKDTDQRQNKWLELSEKTFNFARYARFWFAEGDLQTKKGILNTIGQNLTLKDKKLYIQAHEPFSILRKGLELIPEARMVSEPIENVDNIRKTAALATVNPAWLRG